MPQSEEHVVIIGNGIAGITSARHIRMFSKKRITVISGENEHFFARTALMYVYMGQMTWENIVPYEEWFWKENRIELKKAWVREIDTHSKSVHFEEGSSLKYDKLIVATGALPRSLGCVGEDLPGVQGLVTKQDLELLEENTRNCKKAVIVGGGLIGVELAEMLRSRGIEVSMLIREEAFWRNVLPVEDAQFISQYLKSHNINLLVNTELEKIEKDSNGRACGVKTKSGREISCDLVAI
ncbi:MAG TPA: FAD/NAD(P)-binding oxidoreductase, partial [Salinimicrobium sp.]|nr:FAD/NAD(P)-binding oxidoreductase [Salinimicrobium sp.]